MHKLNNFVTKGFVLFYNFTNKSGPTNNLINNHDIFVIKLMIVTKALTQTQLAATF